MRYEFAPDIQEKAREISILLFPHVKIGFVKCIRSYGTSTKRTLARCHGLGKVFQKAMGIGAFYVLEFLAERFDNLDEEEQIKIIIHELMHIPKAFGGGFRHHDHVTDRNVNNMYKLYMEMKAEKENVEVSNLHIEIKEVKNEKQRNQKISSTPFLNKKEKNEKQKSIFDLW